jgi:hypothetical protein
VLDVAVAVKIFIVVGPGFVFGCSDRGGALQAMECMYLPGMYRHQQQFPSSIIYNIQEL